MPVLLDRVIFGRQLNNGAPSSTTTTVKLQVVKLPAASVALYTIVYELGVNGVPKFGPDVCVTVTVPQLSVATGTLHSTPLVQLASAPMVKVNPLGQFTNVGASVSVTTTVLLQVDVLPFTSTAVQVTVVEPTGNVAPFKVVLLPNPP